jgi:hypothetical protein
MKKRWWFLLSLAWGVLALCLECHAVDESLDAKRHLTQDFIHNMGPKDVAAEILGKRSETLCYFSMPIAAMSGLSLFLSYRRKEPASRWTIGLLLFLYSYLLIGPV